MKEKKIKVIIEYFLKLMLNVLPVIFWLCLIYSFDNTAVANLTILAMIIHEAGHIACVFFFTGKILLPRGDFSGLKLLKNNMPTYLQQFFLYASGVLSNLFAVILTLAFPFSQTRFGELFIAINIATAFSNLLPIDGYDGYRITLLTIEYFNLGTVGYAFLEIISFAFVFAMSIVSLFLVYTLGNGYWIMGIFLGATITKLQKWQKHENSRF